MNIIHRDLVIIHDIRYDEEKIICTLHVDLLFIMLLAGNTRDERRGF